VLYERLGGEGAIHAVVARFYERVTADPDLVSYFAGVDLTRLRHHQAAFLSQATGGPVSYTGRDMAAAHAGLGVTGAAFDRVVDHLVAALQEARVPPAEIAEVAVALGPLREHVVTA
jgi:hemoglobin